MNFIDGVMCVREWRYGVSNTSTTMPIETNKRLIHFYIFCMVFVCFFFCFETRHNCNHTIWKCGNCCSVSLQNYIHIVVKCKRFLKVETDKRCTRSFSLFCLYNFVVFLLIQYKFIYPTVHTTTTTTTTTMTEFIIPFWWFSSIRLSNSIDFSLNLRIKIAVHFKLFH